MGSCCIAMETLCWCAPGPTTCRGKDEERGPMAWVTLLGTIQSPRRSPTSSTVPAAGAHPWEPAHRGLPRLGSILDIWAAREQDRES